MNNLRITSISCVDLTSDGGDAHSIRVYLLHKGFREQDVSVNAYSYNLKYDKNKDFDNGNYIFETLKNKNKFQKIIYYFVINPLIFLFFLFRIPKKNFVLIDKLPFNLVLPFIFFKIIRKSKIIAQYHEFFVINEKNISKLQVFMLKLHFFLWKRLLKHIDLLIVISNDHALYFKKYMKSHSKTYVIPILLIYQKENNNLYNKRNPFRVCYGGAITKSNGVELLIEATKNNPQVVLRIFGNCSSSYREELRAKYGLIVEQGKENSLAKEIYKIQNLLVIPKLKDDRSLGYIPSKLADFFMSGVPVLSTDVGNMSSYIQDKKNGFLVPPDDIEAMREKILSIIDMEENKLRTIGFEGYLSAEQFDYRIQVSNIKNILQNDFLC